MAQVVFEVDLDAGTMANLRELRQQRIQILILQLKELPLTVHRLIKMGAIRSEERDQRADEVQQELVAKMAILQERLRMPDVIFDDELELYLELFEETPA